MLKHDGVITFLVHRSLTYYKLAINEQPSYLIVRSEKNIYDIINFVFLGIAVGARL